MAGQAVAPAEVPAAVRAAGGRVDVGLAHQAGVGQPGQAAVHVLDIQALLLGGVQEHLVTEFCRYIYA